MKYTLSVNNDEIVQATIDIDAEKMRQIKALAKLVKATGAFRLQIFDYTPDWHTEVNGDLVPIEDTDLCVEAIILNIQERSICWSGYIKHTDIYFETDEIDISVEEDNDPAETIRRALACVTQDLEMLRDGSWQPDKSSCEASLEQLDDLRSSLEGLQILNPSS